MFKLARHSKPDVHHLTEEEVFQFAESLSRRSACVSVKWAAHIASCPKCAQKVKAARTTLKIVDLSREIEPPADLADRIIRAARQQMPGKPTVSARKQQAGPLLGRLVAASLAVVCSMLLFFPAVLRLAAISPVFANDISAPVVAESVSGDIGHHGMLAGAAEVDRLRRSMARATLLIEAMRRQAADGADWREREQARLVSQASDELSAARVLMEQASANPRAAARLAEQLERRTEHLKRLYIGQAL